MKCIKRRIIGLRQGVSKRINAIQAAIGAKWSQLKATRLKRVLAVLRHYEHHPRAQRAKAFSDHVVATVSHKEYSGENGAMRAIYSPMRVSMVVMLTLFFTIFVLGSFVPIKSAALATGKVVVLSNNKIVQHLEGGIISKILVSEGDVVEEGQPIMELNSVSSQAARNIARIELYMARITEARLLALKREHNVMEIPDEIVEETTRNYDLQKTIENQTNLFVTQRNMQRGKLATLQQKVAEYDEEIKGFQAQVDSVNGQLELIEEEIIPLVGLMEKGHVTKPRVLALKREEKELEGNRGQYMASIARTRQSIREAELQLTTLRHEFASEMAGEFSAAQTTISDNEERLASADDVVRRTVITAPYEGIVANLRYHTIGGVINPGERIMDIIPQNEQLVVQAQVKPSDIDVVKNGLETGVVFSAYKTRNMPRLQGKVTRVSADVASQDEGQQAEAFYKARVEVDSQELAKLSAAVMLYPGMPVEVFIETGSRSFLGYLFAPITASLDKAFKED